MSESYHTPVLMNESVQGLNLKPNSIVIDATFGGGGHSAAILKQLGKGGKLIAFDQDSDAFANKVNDDRFVAVNANFRYLVNFLKHIKCHGKVNAILADLGVSSHQFDTTERGFSIRGEAELDMRMNKNAKLSAKIVLNTYSESHLIKIFREYADLDNARRVAGTICRQRISSPLKTTAELIKLLEPLTAPNKQAQFFAQVFQAIRIEVNDEVGALKDFLNQCLPALAKGGRLSIISYHSVEDRLVKNFLRSGNFENEIATDDFGRAKKIIKPITKKPLVPDEVEISSNPRSRSAKLRIAEKL